MAQVGCGDCFKRFLAAFLKIAASTAMAMQVDSAGHNVHAVGVDGLVHAVQLPAALAHLLDARVLDDYRATIDPPLGSEYMTVVNLSQHSRFVVILLGAKLHCFSLGCMKRLRFF